MLPIDQLKDAVGMTRLPAEEEATYQTVAGLVMNQLRRIPKATDWFEIDDYRFEVVDMTVAASTRSWSARQAGAARRDSERPAA